MRAVASDYMHWAKTQPPVTYRLSTSEVPHVRMDAFDWGIADLDCDGASHPSYLPLRERIGARYGVHPDRVVCADGCSMANMLAMASLIAPGDTVLFEQPAYEPMLAAARFLGADIRRVGRDPAAGFALDPEAVAAALTPGVRLVVMANLHNPSGHWTHPTDMARIAEAAARAGAHLLVDEVYLDAVTPRPASAVHLGEHVITTNSLTKSYGLSGLRCGWALASPALAERMRRLHDLFGVNQAHQAERLACIAFDRIDAVIGDAPALIAANRARYNAFLAGRPDLDGVPATHGLTAFPRWRGGDTEALDARLRARFDTGIVAGRWFEAPEHFRIGFGIPEPMFAEALERLGQALDLSRDGTLTP